MSSETRRPYRLKERAKRQEDTRRRIAAATAELHQEVGPAHTTIAEIARRAGVQRPTVYSNFPRERDLLAACQAHFLDEHPPPDPAPRLALSDPRARVAGVLGDLYRWYRSTAAMSGKSQRDRRVLPELDALLAETADRQLDELAGALAAGVAAGNPRVRALVRLSLDFLTWERLSSEGLADDAAAALMADAAVAARRV
jgi:AcrR family transcriptional regulator